MIACSGVSGANGFAAASSWGPAALRIMPEMPLPAMCCKVIFIGISQNAQTFPLRLGFMVLGLDLLFIKI